MKYIVPFNIDLDDLIAEDEILTYDQLLASIQKEGLNHNVEVDTEDMTVTGDVESLADFFMMLDGPGPSFNMEEFVNFVHEEGDIAPKKLKTKSDSPFAKIREAYYNNPTNQRR